jgi:uncharacterized membrane protein
MWCFTKMTQDEINKAEWESPDNWTLGSKWLRVYFSRKDSRTFVPKQTPWMGCTLNLGKSAGVAWLIGFLLGIPVLILLITIFILGFVI